MNQEALSVLVMVGIGLVAGIGIGASWGHASSSKMLGEILSLTEKMSAVVEASKKFHDVLKPILLEELVAKVEEGLRDRHTYSYVYSKAFEEVFSGCYLTAQGSLTNEEYALLDGRETISAAMFEELYLPVLYRTETNLAS